MSGIKTYIEAVRVIKDAILRSQYRAASSVNKEQLSLYYVMASDTMCLKTPGQAFGVRMR